MKKTSGMEVKILQPVGRTSAEAILLLGLRVRSEGEGLRVRV